MASKRSLDPPADVAADLLLAELTQFNFDHTEVDAEDANTNNGAANGDASHNRRSSDGGGSEGEPSFSEQQQQKQQLSQIRSKYPPSRRRPPPQSNMAGSLAGLGQLCESTGTAATMRTSTASVATDPGPSHSLRTYTVPTFKDGEASPSPPPHRQMPARPATQPVPTFKGDDDSAINTIKSNDDDDEGTADPSSSSSERKPRRQRRTQPTAPRDGSRSNKQRAPRRGSQSSRSRSGSRGRGGISLNEMFGVDDVDDAASADSGVDSWMEDALLRGMPPANNDPAGLRASQGSKGSKRGRRRRPSPNGAGEEGGGAPPSAAGDGTDLNLSDKSTQELLGEIFDDMAAHPPDAALAAAALGMATAGTAKFKTSKASKPRRRKSAGALAEMGDIMGDGGAASDHGPYRRKSSTHTETSTAGGSQRSSQNPSRRKSEREWAEHELDFLGFSERSGGPTGAAERRRNAKATTEAQGFKRSSSSGGTMPELVLGALEQEAARAEGGGGGGDKGPRGRRKKKGEKGDRGRAAGEVGRSSSTIDDLTNPTISIDDLLQARKKKKAGATTTTTVPVLTITTSAPRSPPPRTSRRRQPTGDAKALSPPPPPDHLADVPVLPVIKTYKVAKPRPDEPAGLFLTKAKNGAVLVHSLSPDSLFRSTPLHPGQEVLSVNEKRVNDPKVAATLITQAKRSLSLRVSTVERSRGFMYCQVKRRGSGAAGGGKGAAGAGTGGAEGLGRHGVRFATTSVDGVRRGTVTEGLVRVSHVDPGGLFAASHPMNRLRTGSVVLTVNGIPVTNGRSALEKIMGSQQLIEVLHCDERAWRAEWVKDGLARVLEGKPPRDPMDVADAIFGRKEDKGDDAAKGAEEKKDNKDSDKSLNHTAEDGPWKVEWKEGREEAIVRRKAVEAAEEGSESAPQSPGHERYAFKLAFDDDVGTCHPELVDADTMMPPADEFDVSLLAKAVNDAQWTMMTVLQNMLRRAQFEMKYGGGGGGRKAPSSAAMGKREASAPTSAAQDDASREYAASVPARQARQLDATRDLALSLGNTAEQGRNAEGRKKTGKAGKIGRKARGNSLDMLSELVQGELGGVDEELSKLAKGLLLVDAVDRKRQGHLRASDTKAMASSPPPEDEIPRRKSVGVSKALAELSPAVVEEWRMEQYEKEAGTTTHAEGQDKMHEFAARQHILEEQYEEHLEEHNRSHPDGDFDDDEVPERRSSMGSMFSMDMIGDFLDYLEDVGDDLSITDDEEGASTPSSTSYDRDEGSPPSPRDDNGDRIEEMTLCISPAEKAAEGFGFGKEDAPPDEVKRGSDELAYITGVWRDVGSKYEISDTVVGSGGFGEVRDCYDKKTGQIYVVKTIFKPAQDDTTKINLIRNEILLLHEAHHPNIVELRDLFEDDKYVHIVMERCTGGDLFDRVVAENPRRLRTKSEAMRHEARTADSMRSILHVLKYLHSKGIVHRDIKPEHFLLTTDDRETQKIKMIDFGLARKHKPGSAPMTTFTGSPSFVAPEVVARRYDHMCDMFSVGVTAYFLLTGMLPFDGPTDEKTFDLIAAGKFKFPSSSVFLSDDAKDFVTKLLRIDPKKRMSASRALSHPWLLKAASC